MYRSTELLRAVAELIALTDVLDVLSYAYSAYLSSQCHIEMWANEKPEDVRKEGKAKQIVKGKIPVG
jgi:hypothetical protein